MGLSIPCLSSEQIFINAKLRIFVCSLKQVETAMQQLVDLAVSTQELSLDCGVLILCCGMVYNLFIVLLYIMLSSVLVNALYVCCVILHMLDRQWFYVQM